MTDLDHNGLPAEPLAEDTLQEKVEALREYKQLRDSRGWQRLLANVLGPQVRLRELSILVDEDDSLDAWAASRRLIGERLGLKLAPTFVDTRIEALEEEIADERRSEADD